MNPYKSYDQLYDEILTSYRNAAPTALTAELHLRAAGLASALWGLYKLIAWTIKQMFPTSASPETLEQYAQELGLTKRDGESWESLLARVLSIYRNVSGGGNPSDVERWAMEVKITVDGVDEYADSVKSYPARFGPGTSVILVSKNSGAPSQALLDAIRDDNLDRCPVVPAEVYAVAATTRSVSLSIKMSGGSTAQAESLITAYMASLQPAQSLLPLIIKGLCMQAGAGSEPEVTPALPTIPGAFERIVLGGITWL